MDFEWCFGTSVLLWMETPTSRARRLAQHEDDATPDALSKQDVAVIDVHLTLYAREASTAPAANL
jgi:hypothetical protein